MKKENENGRRQPLPGLEGPGLVDPRDLGPMGRGEIPAPASTAPPPERRRPTIGDRLPPEKAPIGDRREDESPIGDEANDEPKREAS